MFYIKGRITWNPTNTVKFVYLIVGYDVINKLISNRYGVNSRTRTCNNIGPTADELGDTMNNDVGAEASRGNNHRSKRVVDNDGDALLVGYPAKLRHVSNSESRVRYGLEVQELGTALDDCVAHHFHVGDVHERRRNVAGLGEKVSQQGVGPAVEGPGGHHVAAAADELEEDGGDRGHAAGGAVRGLSALQSRHLTAEIEHGGVEVTAVDEEVSVRAELAREHAAQGLGLHHREGGGGLDGHVHASVLAEFVARRRYRRRRILPRGEHLLFLGGDEVLAVQGIRAGSFLVGEDKALGFGFSHGKLGERERVDRC